MQGYGRLFAGAHKSRRRTQGCGQPTKSIIDRVLSPKACPLNYVQVPFEFYDHE